MEKLYKGGGGGGLNHPPGSEEQPKGPVLIGLRKEKKNDQKILQVFKKLQICK